MPGIGISVFGGMSSLNRYDQVCDQLTYDS
jgi:hypothetical protein